MEGLGAARQALDGARWIRTVSEGSLRPTGQVNLAPGRDRGLGKVRGHYKRTGTGEGRVRAFMLKETHERRRYEDVTGGRKRGLGGTSDHVGKINVENTRWD